MSWHIGKFLAAVLSCCLTSIASAAPTPVNIFRAPGVPGTGDTVVLPGPCYCDQLVNFSPILVLAPDTYDLGTVREYWTAANFTPDGGPDQDILFLMFQPIALTGSLVYGFPDQPGYLYPNYATCAQTDAACIATYAGAWQDFSLNFTLTPGNDAVQIGMVGNYVYLAPAAVPEAPTSALLLAGLALLLPAARAARRRAR